MNEIKEKWVQELELYVDFKSTFILEGEIFDKRCVVDEDSNTISMIDLDHCLYEKVKSFGYDIIVFFDPVNGFYELNKDGSIKRFAKIVKKTQDQDDIEQIELTPRDHNSGSKFKLATEYVKNGIFNKEEPVAIVMNLASRYVESPSNLKEDEQFYYSELFLATQKPFSPRMKDNSKNLSNILFFVANKENDIPAWFFINNPRIKTLHLGTPDEKMRMAYLNTYLEKFPGYEHFKNKPIDEQEKIKRKYVELTNEFRNIDLEQLLKLMKKDNLDLDNIAKAIDTYKYGIKENPWIGEEMIAKLGDLNEVLNDRVKGQDHCKEQVIDVITRAVYGLSGITHSSSSSKPKGVLFFAGPTGTGKTETAKAIAQAIFGSEERLIRFDMSEYNEANSDQRLLGAPPGYVGYEEGGQLTNAIRNNPFSVVLFDEIEKAHNSVLDKFLQILEDGRMTDGKGETVSFAQSIIIFTSNLGISKISNKMTGEITKLVSYDGEKIYNSNMEVIEDYTAYRKTILSGVDDYFNNELRRPEIKNRIGENFVVFEFISKDVAKQITDSQLKKICKNIRENRNIDITIGQNVIDRLYLKVYEKVENGGRGVGNTLEQYFINPLARAFSKHHLVSNAKLKINDIVINEENAELICSTD